MQPRPLTWADLHAVFADGPDDDGGEAASVACAPEASLLSHSGRSVRGRPSSAKPQTKVPSHASLTASTTPFCFNCREEGHSQAQCPQPSRCYICLKSTHQSYQCVENPVPQSKAYQPLETCSHCREKGHTTDMCRRPGGALSSSLKAGAQYRTVDSVFPRPLVLHAAERGPSDADVKQARQQIVAVLTSMHHPILSHVLSASSSTSVALGGGAVSAVSSLRDTEFFGLVLPLLNDPATHFSQKDRETIKRALFVMRSAVAGGIMFGGPRKPTSRPTDRRDATNGGGTGWSQDDGWYEMKTSGLDINVILGGRLDTFRRTRHTAATGARGARGAAGQPTGGKGKKQDDCSVAGASPGNGLCAKDYVYLSKRFENEPTSSPSPSAAKKKASIPTSNKGGEEPAPATPTNRAKAAMAPANAESVHHDDRSSARLQMLHRALDMACSPHRSGQSQEASGTSNAADAGLDRFAAPVPPYLRHPNEVRDQILDKWISRSDSEHSASHGGSHRPQSGSAVRRFLQHAGQRSAATVKSWSSISPRAVVGGVGLSQKPSHPPTSGSNTTGNDAVISNWNQYVREHSGDVRWQRQTPAAGAAKKQGHTGESSASSAHGGDDTDGGNLPHIPVDLVQQWRARFDWCKAKDVIRIDADLERRRVFRQIVAEEQERIVKMCNDWLTAAEDAGASWRAAFAASSVKPDEKLLATCQKSLWNDACRNLATGAALQELRTAAAEELLDYAGRMQSDAGNGGDVGPTAAAGDEQRLSDQILEMLRSAMLRSASAEDFISVHAPAIRASAFRTVQKHAIGGRFSISVPATTTSRVKLEKLLAVAASLLSHLDKAASVSLLQAQD